MGVIGGWRTGASELIFWTLCNMVLELPILLSWALSLSVVSDAFQGVSEYCNTSAFISSNVSVFIAITVVVSVLEFLSHSAVLISAIILHFDNSVFVEVRPNWLSLSATALTGFRLLLTVVGTFGGVYISYQCPSLELRTIISVFIISGWIAILLNSLCVFVMVRRRSSSRTVDEWKSLARCLMCHSCWFGKNRQHELEEQGFNSIAMNLQHIAADVPDLSLSDALLTLTMVRALQLARRRLGYYSGDFISGVHMHSSYADELTESHSSRAHSPLLEDTQPELSGDDWNRVRLAQHYYRYAIGVYGAPLYSLMRPWTLCCLPNCFQSNRSNIYASGCCFCSIKAFFLRTGIPRSDLIYANLTSQAGTAVFYVCADHMKRTMVVSVRGTHSVQDLLNDLLLDLQKLDDYGYPGSHVHAGVFNAAVTILTEICNSVSVKVFLKEHPTYTVVLTGHSLGAAVTSTMTLLTKKVPSLSPWGQRTVHCFAYAPMQMTDITIADSPMSSCITSIVYRNDIIPRLSLRSVRRLKIFMTLLLDMAKSDQDRIRFSRTDVIRSASSTLHPKLSFILDLAKDNEFFRSIEENVQLSSEPKLYVPGRVFHIVDEKLPESQQGCCFTNGDRRSLIYPLERSSLDEIIVSKSMMVQHFPQAYLRALNNVEIPEPTLEILVEPF